MMLLLLLLLLLLSSRHQVCRVVCLLQLLPWSLSSIAFIVLTSVVHASVSNGYLAQAYSLLAVGSIAVFIGLYGTRYHYRTFKLFTAAVAVIVMQVWMCAGRRFPSTFVSVHVLLWALSFAIFIRLTPTVTPKTAWGGSIPLHVETLGFALTVNTGVLSLLMLLFWAPSYFPVYYISLISHVVTRSVDERLLLSMVTG